MGGLTAFLTGVKHNFLVGNRGIRRIRSLIENI